MYRHSDDDEGQLLGDRRHGNDGSRCAESSDEMTMSCQRVTVMLRRLPPAHFGKRSCELCGRTLRYVCVYVASAVSFQQQQQQSLPSPPRFLSASRSECVRSLRFGRSRMPRCPAAGMLVVVGGCEIMHADVAGGGGAVGPLPRDGERASMARSAYVLVVGWSTAA